MYNFNQLKTHPINLQQPSQIHHNHHSHWTEPTSKVC